MKTITRAVVAIATNFSGKHVERYGERVDTVTPVVKEPLGFSFKKRQTS